MRGLVALVLVGLWGCGEPEKPPQDDTEHTVVVRSITAAVDQESAPVTSTVRVTATVQTANALSGPRALAGQLVNFHVVSGGGTVFAGSALTDDTGVAREVWTLGTTAGDQALEVRAVDQTTGEPITYARVTTTATPGAPVKYHWTPAGVHLHENEAWDYSTLHIYGEDSYGNRVDDVPQELLVFRGVWFEGGGYRGTEPQCSMSGTLITCPKPTGFSADCTECFWGPFRAFFEPLPDGFTPSVQIVVD
jgi:hypothetical protein